MNAPIPDHSPIFKHPLILFDGICNLCDHTVRFIIQRDPKEQFRFIPLQSPLGKALLVKFGFPDNYRDSFILIENAQPYTQSTAFIHISKQLCMPWPLFSLTVIFPRALRDFVYRTIGKNRYRWFGMRDYCDVFPDNNTNHRFLSKLSQLNQYS